MPPGIPVATVAVNGSLNAAILAAQMMAIGNDEIMRKIKDYKQNLKQKIVKANEELSQVAYTYKTN
jgi:5-(carboxyamino)imidazole ribonucleotide mutase